MGIASLLLGLLSLVMTIGGFIFTGVPVLGSVMAFGAPCMGLVAIVLGGMEMSRASKSGQGQGLGIAGLILGILGLFFGGVVALTCGMCNACMTGTVASAGQGARAGARAMGEALDEAARQAEQQRVQQQAQQQGAVPSYAPPVTASGGTGPVPVEATTEAVAMLNELCGDVWCEGEHDFRFVSIACDDHQCTVSFMATSDEGATPESGQVLVPRAYAWDAVNGEWFSEDFLEAFGIELEKWEMQHG